MFTKLLPLSLFSLFVCASICSITREDALKNLQVPSLFIQGFLAKKYVEELIKSDPPTPFPLKVLVLDFSDLYLTAENVEILRNEIMRLFRDNLGELDALQITSAFLQVDSLLDYVLHSNLMAGQRSILQKSLLATRREMLELAKKNFNHYWTAMDIILYCPSMKIAELSDIEAYPKLTEPIIPSILLNHVASLGISIGIDSGDCMYAKLAVVSFLFPRITDRELEENEKQALITALLDNAFWMSHVRIGFCISAMIRAGMNKELELLAYNFQLDSWKCAAQFLPPKHKLTNRLENLIRSTQHTLLDELATTVSVYLSRHSLESFHTNWTLMSDDTKLATSIQNIFPEAQTLASIFMRQEKLGHFVTLMGLLYYKIKPGRTMDFVERYKQFSVHVFSLAPSLTLFSTLKCPLNRKKVISDEKLRILAPDAAKAMYIVGLMAGRNYRILTQHALQKNLNIPERFDSKPFLKIKDSSEIQFFLDMCEVIAHFNVKQHSLVPVLEEVGALAFLREGDVKKLPDPMRCLLVEALIGMHLVAQVQVPRELLEIEGPYTLSATVGRMRKVFKVVPLTDLLGFARGKLREMCFMNYMTYSMLLQAIIPIAMDGPCGHFFFMEFFTQNAVVAHENLSPVMSHIMTVLHEFSPIEDRKYLMVITAFLDLKVPLKANWTVPLSIDRKRSFIKTYTGFATPLLLADAGPFLNQRPFSDIDPPVILLNYAMGKNSFDADKIAAATASLIFSVIHGEKTPKCVPRMLSEAIFKVRVKKHMPFYEIVVRVKFLLIGLLNLELCEGGLAELIIENISTSRAEFSEKIQSDYEAAFPRPKLTIFKAEPLPKKESTDDVKKDPEVIVEIEKKSANRPAVNRKRQPKSRKNLTRRDTDVSLATFQPATVLPLNSHTNAEPFLSQIPPAKLSSKSAPLTDVRSSSLNEKESEELHFQREQRHFKLTRGLLEKNVELLSDGRLQLKAVISEKFKQCLVQQISDGTPFPFKFHEKSLVEVSKWINKHVVLPVWWPRIYRPVKVFLAGYPLGDIKRAHNIIMQLPELTLARLQSLVYYSSKMKMRTVKIRIVPSQEPKVNNGWLEVPFWKEGRSLTEHVKQIVQCDPINAYKPKSAASLRKQFDLKSPIIEKEDELEVEEELVEIDIEKKPVAPFKYSFIQTNDLMRLSDAFSFAALKNHITPDNFEKMFLELQTLITSRTVEYVAFDCEMTGIYTNSDEELHNQGARISDDNLAKLHRGLKANSIFQLGLVIKTRSNHWSVWNFFTCPTLFRKSFTPGTFKFLFTDPARKRNSQKNLAFLAEIKLESIRAASIDPVTQLKELVNLLFQSQVPLIVYSGFADILHLLKIVGNDYEVAHEQIKEIISNPIFDVKEIAIGLDVPVLHSCLELFAQSLYERAFAKDMLHDASFDAVLTALVYEALILKNADFVTASQGRLYRLKPNKK